MASMRRLIDAADDSGLSPGVDADIVAAPEQSSVELFLSR